MNTAMDRLMDKFADIADTARRERVEAELVLMNLKLTGASGPTVATWESVVRNAQVAHKIAVTAYRTARGKTLRAGGG